MWFASEPKLGLPGGLGNGPIYPDNILGYQVAISPEGSAVVLTARNAHADGWSLWRVDLADGKSARLTRGIEDTSPSWAR